MKPVVKALICAHDAGILHRDLKPANIMLADTGGTKVLDFGLAQALGHRAADASQAVVLDEDATKEIKSNQRRKVSGTLPYMSPEQLHAEPLDERSDLWAIGIMLFELLTGHHPLAPVTPRTIRQIGDLSQPMPRVTETRDDLGRLGTLIDRCLSKRRESRPQNADAVLSELEASVAATARKRPTDRNPYLGLSAFHESDADRYFGREQEVQQATRRLVHEVMLTVAGPSGAGKSSFVRAGLIASLKRSGEPWEAFIIRPGPQPILALTELFDSEGSLPASSQRSQGARCQSRQACQAGTGLTGRGACHLAGTCRRPAG
jgi:serine/threonine protein kinase